jgi:predicted nucleic acid-binding protein
VHALQRWSQRTPPFGSPGRRSRSSSTFGRSSIQKPPTRRFGNRSGSVVRGHSAARSEAGRESSLDSLKGIGLRLTIDSLAWIELILGARLRIETRERIEAAESCFTPSIVLADVPHRCLRDGFGEPLMRRELQAISESSEGLPIDSDLAIAASSATMELRERANAQRLRPPGLGDGLVLASARRTDSRLLTGDPRFRGRRETIWLGWGPAGSKQPNCRRRRHEAGRVRRLRMLRGRRDSNPSAGRCAPLPLRTGTTRGFASRGRLPRTSARPNAILAVRSCES